MEQRLTCITLGVADLARARAFYEALGWTSPSVPDAHNPGWPIAADGSVSIG